MKKHLLAAIISIAATATAFATGLIAVRTSWIYLPNEDGSFSDTRVDGDGSVFACVASEEEYATYANDPQGLYEAYLNGCFDDADYQTFGQISRGYWAWPEEEKADAVEGMNYVLVVITYHSEAFNRDFFIAEACAGLFVREGHDLEDLTIPIKPSSWRYKHERVEMAIYRMWNPYSGEYLYSGSEIEMDAMVAAGWIREGVVFWALSQEYKSAIPLYRLIDPSTGLHLYSSTEQEREILERDYGWVCEGVAFYVDAGEKGELLNSTAVYRARSNVSGQYLFSSSEVERQALDDNPDWTVEGVAFWATSSTCTITLVDELDDSTLPFQAAYNDLLPTIVPPSRPGLLFAGYEYRYTLDNKDYADMAYDELGKPIWDCVGDMTLYAVWIEPDDEAELTPIYRLSSNVTGDHIFTANEDERDALVATGIWTNEGVAFKAYGTFADGTVPLYRLYSPSSGEHLFSATEAEKNALVAGGWSCDEIVCFVGGASSEDAVSVTRLCLPWSGYHLFTMTEEEKSILVLDYGCIDEGVAFYVWP